MLNFMIAGRDTTACALSWSLFELAKAPAVQAKLRAEFESVFDLDPPPAAVDGSADGAAAAAASFSKLQDQVRAPATPTTLF